MDFYKLSVEDCLGNLQSNVDGLSKSEVDERLAEYGRKWFKGVGFSAVKSGETDFKI